MENDNTIRFILVASLWVFNQLFYIFFWFCSIHVQRIIKLKFVPYTRIQLTYQLIFCTVCMLRICRFICTSDKNEQFIILCYSLPKTQCINIILGFELDAFSLFSVNWLKELKILYWQNKFIWRIINIQIND